MSGTYGQTVSRFARWAFGQRIVHDVVVHPLMALTNYSDWSLKLHDYHSFAACEPGEPGAIGIMGRVEDVHAAFEKLGIEIEHTHTDGLVCCGTGGSDGFGGGTARRFPRNADGRCARCNGRGGWYAAKPSWDTSTPARWITCDKCGGAK